MDTLLRDGDFAVDALGRPIPIEGAEELFQQVKLRLLIKKGSFVYDPALGSRLTAIKGGRRPEGQALALAAEALRDLPGVTPVAAEVIAAEGLNIRLRLSLETGGIRRQMEVEL